MSENNAIIEASAGSQIDSHESSDASTAERSALALDKIAAKFPARRDNRLTPLSRQQVYDRLDLLPVTLSSPAYGRLAKMLRHDFALRRLTFDWASVFKHWASKTKRLTVEQIETILSVAGRSKAGGDAQFGRKAFDALTRWAQSPDAVGATSLPRLDKEGCGELLSLPQVLPKNPRPPMPRGPLSAAYGKNAEMAAMIADAVVEGFKQDRLDRYYRFAMWAIGQSKNKRRHRNDKKRSAMRRVGRYVESMVNRLVAQGWGHHPMSKQRKGFKRKVIVWNSAPGSGKSTTNRALMAGLNHAATVADMKALVIGEINSRAGGEGLSALKVYGLKVVYSTSDTDKAREAVAEAETKLTPEQRSSFFYRPGVGAPDPYVHSVHEPLPSRGVVHTCWRHDEREAFGSADVSGEILCGSKGNRCAFWGHCLKSIMPAIPAFRNADSIISAGMIGFDSADAIKPHKTWREHLQVLDDFGASSFVDVTEYAVEDLNLPDCPQWTDDDGNLIELTPEEQRLDDTLRSALKAVEDMIRSTTREHRTREFTTTAGGETVEMFTAFGVWEITRWLEDRYASLPTGDYATEGFATRPEIVAALSRRKQALRLKRLLDVVLTPPPSGGDLDCIYDRSRWAVRLTKSSRNPLRNTLVLTQVKAPGGNPTAPIVVIDGTASLKFLRAVFADCKVIGGDAPRIEYPPNVKIIQYDGKVYGMGTHAPVADDIDEAIAVAEAEVAAFERDCTERGVDPYADWRVRGEHANLNGPVSRGRLARQTKLENATRVLIAAMSRARELNAQGKRLLVVSYKHLARFLERSGKVPGCDFDVLNMHKGRGLNRFQKCAEIWFIGRPGTPAVQAGDIASALTETALDIEVQDRLTGSRWMADGTLKPAPLQELLSHDLAQEVLEQLTVAEVFQGIERARLALRDGDGEVVVRIFTSASIPYLPVYETISLDPLPHWGNDAHRLMLEVAPVAGEGMYQLYGALRHTDANTTGNLFRQTAGAAARLERLLAQRDAGELLADGWSRWSVTLSVRGGYNTTTQSKIVYTVEVGAWLRCPAGDVAAAEGVLRGQGGVVVKAEPVGQVAEKYLQLSREGGANHSPIKKDYNDPEVKSGDLGTVGPNYSDPLAHLISSGDFPVLGAKGYTELAEFLLGGVVKAKTVRNRVATDGALRARWQAAATAETVTHRVTLPGGTFSIPACLSPATVESLRLRECRVDPVAGSTPPDGSGKRRGRPRKEQPGDQPTGDGSGVAGIGSTSDASYVAPGLNIQYFTDPAVARAAHMRRDALGLAEVIAAGGNDLALIGFEEGEAQELLEMVRKIAARQGEEIGG